MPTSASKKPPRDVNRLAKYIVEVTTGEAEKIGPPKKGGPIQRRSQAAKKEVARPQRPSK